MPVICCVISGYNFCNDVLPYFVLFLFCFSALTTLYCPVSELTVVWHNGMFTFPSGVVPDLVFSTTGMVYQLEQEVMINLDRCSVRHAAFRPGGGGILLNTGWGPKHIVQILDFAAVPACSANSNQLIVDPEIPVMISK